MRATAIMGLVRRLLTHEAAENQGRDSLILAAERVSDKLRLHLSKRIGQEGFQTLLARALTLATAQFPLLSAVRVGSDGSLVGLQGAAAGSLGETQDNETQYNETQLEIAEGAVALLANFLGLLVTFIGEDLTLRILSTVWPELALGDTADGENETT